MRNHFASVGMLVAAAMTLSGCFSGEGSVRENADVVIDTHDRLPALAKRPVVELDFAQAKAMLLAQSPGLMRAKNTLRVAREAHERHVVSHLPVVQATAGISRMVSNLKTGADPSASIGMVFSSLNLIGENIQWYADSVNMEAAEIQWQFTARSQVAAMHDMFRRAQELAERKFWRKYLGPAAFGALTTGNPKDLLRASNNSYLSDVGLELEEQALSLAFSQAIGDFTKQYRLVGASRPALPAPVDAMGDLRARLFGAQLEGLWLRKLGAYVPLVPEVSLSFATPPVWSSPRQTPTSWGASQVNVSAGAQYGLMQYYSISDVELDVAMSKRELLLFVETQAQQRQGLSASLSALTREQLSLKYDLEALRDKVKSSPSGDVLVEVQSTLARRHSLEAQRDGLLYDAWVDNDAAWEKF